MFDVFKVFDEKGFRNVLMVSKCLMVFEVFDVLMFLKCLMF